MSIPSEPSPSPFRVIIIGGGPVGLSLANMLVKADIDYIIIEKHHEIVSETGACLMIMPAATRIFHQLGLLDRTVGEYYPVQDQVKITHAGKVTMRVPMFKYWEENHGYPTMNYPRHRLVRNLYENLPPSHRSSRILTSATITDMRTTADSATVHLSSGQTVTGSLIIGTDGCHSITRSFFSSPATSPSPAGTIPPKTTYLCLYGTTSNPPPGLDHHVFYQSQGPRTATQLVVGPESAHFGLFHRLDVPEQGRITYSKEEEEKYVEEVVGDVFVAPGLTARELYFQYAAKGKEGTWTRLVQQPEGLAGGLVFWDEGDGDDDGDNEDVEGIKGTGGRMGNGRVVLCGDSAMQVTSSAGMGYNAGLQSAACLANQLARALDGGNGEKGVKKERLREELQEYEEEMRAQGRRTYEISSQLMRGITWDGWMAWFMTEWVFWIVNQKKLAAKMGGMLMQPAFKLDFVDLEDERSGLLPWTRSAKPKVAGEKK